MHLVGDIITVGIIKSKRCKIRHIAETIAKLRDNCLSIMLCLLRPDWKMIRDHCDEVLGAERFPQFLPKGGACKVQASSLPYHFSFNGRRAKELHGLFALDEAFLVHNIVRMEFARGKGGCLMT